MLLTVRTQTIKPTQYYRFGVVLIGMSLDIMAVEFITLRRSPKQANERDQQNNEQYNN